MSTPPPVIVTEALRKRFGSVEVLKGIDFAARDGEVVSRSP